MDFMLCAVLAPKKNFIGLGVVAYVDSVEDGKKVLENYEYGRVTVNTYQGKTLYEKKKVA